MRLKVHRDDISRTCLTEHVTKNFFGKNVVSKKDVCLNPEHTETQNETVKIGGTFTKHNNIKEKIATFLKMLLDSFQ